MGCAPVIIIHLTEIQTQRVFIVGIVYWEFEFIKFLMERLRCDQGTIPVAGAAPGPSETRSRVDITVPLVPLSKQMFSFLAPSGAQGVAIFVLS